MRILGKSDHCLITAIEDSSTLPSHSLHFHPSLKALDVCCGLGGISDAFVAHGFEVLGIEIKPRVARRYKHPVIVADFRTLESRRFRDFDFIWGSPPCRDFSTLTQANKGYANRKSPDPIAGLKTIHAFLDFVDAAKPTFWAMENVSNLEKFLKLEPIWRFRISKRGRRSLWGNIPLGMMPDFHSSRNLEFDYCRHNYHMRSLLRSRIPLRIGKAIAQAVRKAILNKRSEHFRSAQSPLSQNIMQRGFEIASTPHQLNPFRGDTK